MNTCLRVRLALIILPLLISSCIYEQEDPGINCDASSLALTIDQNTGASGCETADGSFIVSASGGIEPYLFETSFESNNDGIFEGLLAGIYDVTVADSVGCTQEVSVTIANLTGVNLDEILSTDAGCGTADGSIEIFVTGGVEPYAFSLNSGVPQEDNLFEGLGLGSYDVLITDASGCEITQQVEIETAISYEATIKPIIETNCAISGCHNGSVSPDLRTFGSIQASASRIKARTSDRSMPRGRTLTQTQIDQIACWVDAGAVDN